MILSFTASISSQAELRPYPMPFLFSTFEGSELRALLTLVAQLPTEALIVFAYEDKSLSEEVSTLMLTFRTPSVFILQNLIFPPVGLIQFLLRL